LKAVASVRLLSIAFVAARARDARFTGTWYRPIPLLLRLSPVAPRASARARSKPTAVVSPAGPGPRAMVRSSWCSLRNVPRADGAGRIFSLRSSTVRRPPRVVVSRGQCQAFDGMVAEEYAPPDSRASARSPSATGAGRPHIAGRGRLQGRRSLRDPAAPAHRRAPSRASGTRPSPLRWSSRGDVIRLRMVASSRATVANQSPTRSRSGGQRSVEAATDMRGGADLADRGGPAFDLADGTDSRSGAAPDSLP
jgi:hypothetical protein